MEKKNLILLKLHANKQYLDQCCDLLNDFWPRSETARLHSLNKSNDNYPCNFVLVNSNNDQLIGHVTVSLDNRYDNRFKAAYIESFIIHKDYRRQGLGQFMMLELEKLLVQEQFNLMCLKTIDQLKFYESIGFVLKSKTKLLVIGQRRRMQNTLLLNSQLNNQANETSKQSNEANNKSNFINCLNSIIPPPPLPQPKIDQSNQLYEYHMEKSINLN